LPKRVLFIAVLLIASSLGQCLRAQNFPERVWWTPGSISSLPVMDSLQTANPMSFLALDFLHTLSLYNWSSSLRLSSNTFVTPSLLSPQFSVNAEARSRLREDTRIRTSEATALIGVDYPLDEFRDGLMLSFFGTTYSLNGNAAQSFAQIGTLKNVSDGYGLLSGKYFPVPFIEISAGGGIAHKSFEIGTSSGWIAKGGIIASPSSLSNENIFEGDAAFDERHFSLSDEVLRNDNIHAHLISNFSESGYNDASGGAYFKRRDFFFQKDTSGSLAKQERGEIGFDIHDGLVYPFISKHLLGSFHVDLSPHQITRRTPSIDITAFPTTVLTTSTFLVPSTTSALEADLDGRIDYFIGEALDTSRMTQFSAEMKFEEKSETSDIIQGETGSLSSLEVKKLSDALGQTSFDGKQTALTLSANFPLASYDALHIDFSSRMYRYDTPSKDNHDDRDELNLGSILQYSHYFSKEFALINELHLTESHLVYLESDRSLQNYVSKTISFASQTLYHSPSFEHQMRGEVFANYSVYDFASPISDVNGIRDYLIRGVNGSDSIRISLGKLPEWNVFTAIEGIFDLRLYERGAYNAIGFSERPILRTSEFSGDLTLNVTDGFSPSPTLIKIGARAFFLRRYSPIVTSSVSDLELQEHLNRVGPLFIIIIDQLELKGPRLYGSVWYSFVEQKIFDTNITNSSRQVEARLSAQWTF
jgi:hypothetical protein